MAQQPDATMAALAAENPTSQYGFALGQIPNLLAINTSDPNALATTQMMLPDILSYNISRSQSQQSDTCSLTFADDMGVRLSTNSASSRAWMFYPGPVQKTVEVYLGYKGAINSGKPNFQAYANEAVIQFTGFVETDANAQSPFELDKTVTLNDLTSQFKQQVYDTFPHALFGDQTLTYFDPLYNLTNPSGDGVTWVCIGKMFTMNSNDPVWGATNMAVQVFIDTSGGKNPQSTPLGGTGNYVSAPTYPNTVGHDQNNLYTFDFANGIIVLNTSIPEKSTVSLRGNPTYMAPEIMVYKLLVEKGGWNPKFLDIHATNLLIPMYDGQDQSIWQCLSDITAMCSPRFVPWQVWCDEAGTIHFYESNLDSPPKRQWVNGAGVFTASHEYTARDVKTVVRADATVAIAGTGIGSGSDQSVTSIAYDNKAIIEYGLTEPLLLSSAVDLSVAHLSPTQAVAHLNLIAQSMLYSVARPVYTITVDMVPDYFIQIGDKVSYVDDNLHIDKEFEIVGQEKQSDGKMATMQCTLQEYYETINFNVGVPSGVSFKQTGEGATQSPPNSAIIGAVKMGTNPLYVFRYGDYVRDAYNNPIIANWSLSDGNPMSFDYQIWSKAKSEGGNNPWNFNNLPPLSSPWNALDPDGNYYVPHNASDGNTYCCKPDSTFYQYNNGANPPHNNPGSPPASGGGGGTHWHCQLGIDDIDAYIWIPPGNRTGGNNGKGYTAAVWAWWYLCLDSTVNDPATGKPYWQEPFQEKYGRILQRFVNSTGTGHFGMPGSSSNTNGRLSTCNDGQQIIVPDNNSVLVSNTWTAYPGPDSSTGVSKIYANLAIGLSDYTNTPPGFVGCGPEFPNLGGVQLGVAYGTDVGSTQLYVNYQKVTRGHYCIYAIDSDGGSQFLRIPFNLTM